MDGWMEQRHAATWRDVIAAHNDSGLHTVWIWLKWTKFTVMRLYCRLLTKLYRFIIVAGCRMNQSFLQAFTCSWRCFVATFVRLQKKGVNGGKIKQKQNKPKKHMATLWSILLDSVIWPIVPHIATWRQRSSVCVYYRTLDCLWFYRETVWLGVREVSTLWSQVPIAKVCHPSSFLIIY